MGLSRLDRLKLNRNLEHNKFLLNSWDLFDNLDLFYNLDRNLFNNLHIINDLNRNFFNNLDLFDNLNGVLIELFYKDLFNDLYWNLFDYLNRNFN